jgi:hypothetical protein
MRKGYVFEAQIDGRHYNNFRFDGINPRLLGRENIEIYNMDTKQIDWISWKWFIGRDVQIISGGELI